MLVHFDVVTVLRQGLELFGFDPDTLGQTFMKDCFREFHGCHSSVVVELWDEMNVPDAQLKHLFWTLCFFKQCPRECQMRVTFEADPTTICTWLRRVAAGIFTLENDHVSFWNSLVLLRSCIINLQLTNCLDSVDRFDCRTLTIVASICLQMALTFAFKNLFCLMDHGAPTSSTAPLSSAKLL